MPSTNRAYRAYLRRFIPTMTIYVALVAILPFLIRATAAKGVLLWFLACLPGVAIASVFWIIGRLLVELDDEYLRMLEVRKALVATGFAMTLASIWGFLETYANAPHLPAFFVPIAWFAGLAVGAVFNHYRAARDTA